MICSQLNWTMPSKVNVTRSLETIKVQDQVWYRFYLYGIARILRILRILRHLRMKLRLVDAVKCCFNCQKLWLVNNFATTTPNIWNPHFKIYQQMPLLPANDAFRLIGKKIPASTKHDRLLKGLTLPVQGMIVSRFCHLRLATCVPLVGLFSLALLRRQLPMIGAGQPSIFSYWSLLTAAYPTGGRSKHNEGWALWSNFSLWSIKYPRACLAKASLP